MLYNLIICKVSFYYDNFYFIAILFFAIKALRLKKQFDKTLSDIHSTSPYRKQKKDPLPNNKNDFLKKDKEEEIEKAQEEEKNMSISKSQGVEIIPKENKQEMTKDSEIVGVATPKGFWTKFIMSQKLGFILGRISGQNVSGQGFWANLVKAQAASQGKEKGRGR